MEYLPLTHKYLRQLPSIATDHKKSHLQLHQQSSGECLIVAASLFVVVSALYLLAENDNVHFYTIFNVNNLLHCDSYTY